MTEPLPAGTDNLIYIDRKLTVYTCMGADRRPVLYGVDAATAELADRKALGQRNLDAFVAKGKLGPGLMTNAIQNLSPDAPVDVQVWLRIDTSDLPLPANVTDSGEAAWVDAQREQRIKQAALSLSDGVDQISGAYVRTEIQNRALFGVPSIPVTVRRRDLDRIGQLPFVNFVQYAPRDAKMISGQSWSDNYLYTDQVWFHELSDWDGSGITVALYEGAYPASFWNLPTAYPASACPPDPVYGGPPVFATALPVKGAPIPPTQERLPRT